MKHSKMSCCRDALLPGLLAAASLGLGPCFGEPLEGRYVTLRGGRWNGVVADGQGDTAPRARAAGTFPSPTLLFPSQGSLPPSYALLSTRPYLQPPLPAQATDLSAHVYFLAPARPPSCRILISALALWIPLLPLMIMMRRMLDERMGGGRCGLPQCSLPAPGGIGACQLVGKVILWVMGR
jgi:hypothetical protein